MIFYSTGHRASIFIGAVVITLIISLLTIYAFTYINHSIQLQSEMILAEKNQSETKNQTIEDSSNKSTLNNLVTCQRVTASSELYPIERKLCGVSSKFQALNQAIIIIDKNSAGFPIFSYNSIFRINQPCENESTQQGSYSKSGFRLSDKAVHSAKNCFDTLKQAKLPLVYHANWEPHEEVQVDQNTIVNAWFGSTGYVDLSKLIVNSDILLVAGGDIHIASLNSGDGLIHNVNIVSATGRVVVDALGELIRIRIVAREGAQISGSVKISDSSYFPLQLSFQILGLI